MIQGGDSVDRGGGDNSHGGDGAMPASNEASNSEKTGRGGISGAADSDPKFIPTHNPPESNPGDLTPQSTAPNSPALRLNAAVPEFAPRSTGHTPLLCDADTVGSAAPPVHRSTSAPASLIESSKLPAGELQPQSPRASTEVVTLVKKPEETDSTRSSTSTSHIVDTPSAITDAFRSAPPARSFRELIAQTQNILTAHSRPAPELSSIRPGFAPPPTREAFEASWALNRTRSRAFPQAQQAQDSTSANNKASAASPSPVSTSAKAIKLPSGRIVFATPPPLRSQVEAALSTPTRNVSSRSDGSSEFVARLRHRVESQTLSQSTSTVFSGSRQPNRRLSFTPTKTPLRLSQSSTRGSPFDQPNDTPEQKEKIRNLMSSFAAVGDSFDSVEWPHNEGQANYSESPETLTVPPQPVASYTTVGSLRPATNQQFTAPNRIQRDGTGRRAPQANLQNRGHDNHFVGRTMNQQYSPGYGSSTYPQYGATNYSQYGSATQQHTGSSMQSHYGSMNHLQHNSTPKPRFGLPAQSQYGAMPPPQYGTPNQSEYGAPSTSQFGSTQHQHGYLTQYGSENRYSYGSSAQSGYGSIHNLQTRDSLSSVGLNDAEAKKLQTDDVAELLVGSVTPSMRSGNVPRQSRDTMPRFDPLLNPQAESFNLQNQPIGSASGQTQPIQNSLPKIEIAENLPQHRNPMQQMARNTHSDSTATNIHHFALSTGLQQSQPSVTTGATSYGQALNANNDQGNADYDSQERGDLDHNYRFPPPGLVHPRQADQSSAGYGQRMVSGFGSNEQVTTNQRSGRPPALIAGPPGQRHNVSAPSGISSAQGIQVGVSPLSNVQYPPTLPFNSPWLPNGRNNMFTSVQSENSILRDTLPPAEVRLYYPNGFPNDMLGQYTRLRGAVNEGNSGMSEEQRTNNWFHGGLRNLDMTANDYIAEMDRRNRRLENIPNAQLSDALDESANPVTLRGLTETSEPLTVEQIKTMDITEISARLLGPVFGTTLRIADQRPGPHNLALLSRYAPGAPWTIDDSPQENQSFFGEDWGPTPRRVGRDPRYQAFE